MKIGIINVSLGIETKASLRKSAELGADGVQLWVAGGDLDPQNLTGTGRQDLLHFLKSINLEISALCGDLGKGYANPSVIDWCIKRTKEIIDLSVDLKAPIITTHIGEISEDENSTGWKTMLSALTELGRYAETYGSCLATETGPEEPKLMTKFFRALNNKTIKVNYDPANLVMSGFDHIAGVAELKDYIVHTHAKDGTRSAEGVPQEVALGKGKVDFPRYIKTLKENGYDGYLTIERECGENPARDIQEAITFLRSII